MSRRESTFVSDNGVRVFKPKNKSDYWILRWTEDGKRKETTAGKTEADALDRAATIDKRLSHEQGSLSLLPAVDWLDAWLDPNLIRSNGRPWSKNHLGETKRRMNAHLRPQLLKIRSEDVRSKHLKAAIASAPTPKEKQAVLRNLRTLVKFGISKGWILQDFDSMTSSLRETIVQPVKAHVAGTSSSLYVDPALRPGDKDVRALVEATSQIDNAKWWYELMPLLAAYSGIRLGELLDLDVSDFDLKKREILIDSQCLEATGFPRTRELPKYNTVRKTIFPKKTPWGYDLAAALKKRIEEAKEEEPFLYDNEEPRHLLFPAPRGGWWSQGNFGKRVRRPAQRIANWKLDSNGEFIWNFHSLRHTFCSGLLEKGKSVVDIAVAAGHRNPNTTWQMYMGAGPDALDRLKS
jgi:integrase